MILVLMRHDDCSEIFGRETDAIQACNDIDKCEAAIDQDAGGVRFDYESVTFAAAAEGSEADHAAGGERRKEAGVARFRSVRSAVLRLTDGAPLRYFSCS